MDQEALLIAIEAKNWYAVAAIVIGTFIFLWKKIAPVVWKRISPRWRFLVPLFLGWATGFVGGFVEGKDLMGALLQAFVAAFYAGLPAAGGHHVLKDAPISYGEGEKRHPTPPSDDNE